MYSSRLDERMTWVQSSACGGIAAIASRTLTSPFEVVKVLAQVGTEQTWHGLAKTFANVYRTEGIRAFWKGNYITCFRLFPYSSLQFLTFNSLMVRSSQIYSLVIFTNNIYSLRIYVFRCVLKMKDTFQA